MTGRVLWSKGVYGIFDRDPDKGPIEVSEAHEYVESDSSLVGPWLSLIRYGVPMDIEVRRTTGPTGQRLRIQACAAPGPDGRPGTVYGECRVLDD
jgi:hypothetical protein